MRYCRKCRQQLYDYWFPPASRGKPAALVCNLCRAKVSLERAQRRHDKLARNYVDDLGLIAAANAGIVAAEQRRRRELADWAMARLRAAGESPEDAQAAVDAWNASVPMLSEGNDG